VQVLPPGNMITSSFVSDLTPPGIDQAVPACKATSCAQLLPPESANSIANDLMCRQNFSDVAHKGD